MGNIFWIRKDFDYMNFNSIKEYCFCLNVEEMRDFILKTKYKNEYIEEFGNVENGKKDWNDYEFLCEIADLLGFVCYSAENEFGLVFYDLEYRNKKFEIDKSVVFALPFERDTLFQKYEDYNDIYTELYAHLKENNVEIDIEYIKEHCGLLEGVEVYD